VLVLEEKEESLVKQVCKEYDLTVNQLSEKLEIPRGTIGRWMSNKDLPRTAELLLKSMLKNRRLEKKLESFKVFKNALNDL
jgi:transcriptional regulator with XRE-family HTH domain